MDESRCRTERGDRRTRQRRRGEHHREVAFVAGHLRLTRDLRGILSEPARARAMADAALSLGRPDAAARLYDLVTELTS